MTEEQKIKRAKELYGNLVYPKTHIELYVDGYLAGTKELETENNKLLDVINNQDVKIADLEKQIEKMKCCGNCAYRTVDLLTFNPFCDKRKLKIENPLTCKCDKWKLVN